MKRLLIFTILLILLTSCVPTQRAALPTETLSIQGRVNAASSGDVINVTAGTYNERITVSKNGISLIAIGKVNTKQIYVTGNNNIVRGFTITDATADSGIRVTGNGNLFENNEVSNTMQDGVWFWGYDNTFRGNYIHDILDPSAAGTNNGDPHVDCFQTWDWNWDTYNVLFENNICEHTRAEGSNQIFMVSGSRARDNIIRGNRLIMHDAGYSPVALYGGTWTLENNYICNTTGAGSVAVYGTDETRTKATNNTYIGYSSFGVGGTNNVKGNLPCVVGTSITPTATFTTTRTPTATPTVTATQTLTPTYTPTPTKQGIKMIDYITTTQAQLYNNNGVKAEVWPAGKTFSTGDWIDNRNGTMMLYLGPTLLNRWIKVGDYDKVGIVTPPPVDPPPPSTADTIINIRKSNDGGVTWYESKYYEEIPPE